MTDAEITGADKVGAFVKALRAHAGKTALAKEVREALKDATTPLHDDLRASISSALPKRGGLAAEIERTIKFTTVARNGRWAGVWIRGASKPPHYLRELLKVGEIRHPVYGNRRNWVSQVDGTNPTAFLSVMDRAKGQVGEVVMDRLERVAQKIINEGT